MRAIVILKFDCLASNSASISWPALNSALSVFSRSSICSIIAKPPLFAPSPRQAQARRGLFLSGRSALRLKVMKAILETLNFRLKFSHRFSHWRLLDCDVFLLRTFLKILDFGLQFTERFNHQRFKAPEVEGLVPIRPDHDPFRKNFLHLLRYQAHLWARQ